MTTSLFIQQVFTWHLMYVWGPSRYGSFLGLLEHMFMKEEDKNDSGNAEILILVIMKK